MQTFMRDQVKSAERIFNIGVKQTVWTDDRWVLSIVLERLGFSIMSKDILKETNGSVLQKYIKIAEREATKLKDHESLERLWSCGLIY